MTKDHRYLDTKKAYSSSMHSLFCTHVSFANPDLLGSHIVFDYRIKPNIGDGILESRLYMVDLRIFAISDLYVV